MVFFPNSSSRCQWSTWLKGYLWLYCGVISREVVTQALEEKAHIRLFWIEKIGAGELKLSGALTKDGINSKLKNHRKKDMHDINYRCKFVELVSFFYLCMGCWYWHLVFRRALYPLSHFTDSVSVLFLTWKFSAQNLMYKATWHYSNIER